MRKDIAVKSIQITKQPDGTWKQEIVEAQYPDPQYEARVQALANATRMVAVGAQSFEAGKEIFSADPIVIDLSEPTA